MYLKGERNTSRGINKFMLVCHQRTLALYVIFDPLGRGDEVASLGAHSLMINGNPIPIAQLQIGRTETRNGWTNINYKLTPELIQKIQTAKTVGVALQFVYDAPTFMGFDDMDLESGRTKLEGLLTTCRK